ncbi:MAG: class I SAM-dependent methyltransferase [Spirochaetaceae bacterium]|nr:MAG: class I SAM-dependent methyltransferase [Spirochaetaceae bacterium]
MVRWRAETNSCRRAPMMPQILLCPETAVGAGTGHLRRAIRLCKQLSPDARIYLAPDVRDGVVHTVSHELGASWIERDPAALVAASAIVIDRPIIPREEVAALCQHAVVIGLDAGGSGRALCNYTIDIIPRLRDDGRANLRSTAFLELPRSVRSAPPAIYPRILVTFGGEDPKRLTPRMVEALLQTGEVNAQQVTVVRGPLAAWDAPGDVRVLDRPSNLMEMLCDYDLVCTSFGLTALEAAAARCAVVLLNPTRYHARLGKRVGFTDVGVVRVNRRALGLALSDPALGLKSAALVDRRASQSLARTIARIAQAPPARCPICRRPGGEPIFRDADRSFYRCSCGVLFRTAFTDPGIAYDEAYFFEEYRAQYGRTYLEDFAHIRVLGLARARRVMRAHKPPKQARSAKPRLLDIGCAYGPFLDAAQHSGFACSGLDVATAAVRHVRDVVGIPAVAGSISDPSVRDRWKPGDLDAVTMWYVIEHIDDLRPLLRWVQRTVAPGGVFAFATPNARGISGRLDRSAFLRMGPRDHVTVWTPTAARRVLRRFGFHVVRVVVTGHHPERFPGCGAVRPGTVAYRLLLGASRLLRLGDTFEVYARRREERE